MNPYRAPGIPALDSTNAMWCVVCLHHKHISEAMSFKHPSGIGSVSVCNKCFDGYKKRLANRCNWTIEEVSKHFVFRLTYSLQHTYCRITHYLLPNNGGYR